VKPAECDINSPIVGSCAGASSIGTPSLPMPANTFKLLNSGMCLETRSVGFHLPSSYNIIMATPVTGLVIE
jgi:hypothetical protein